MAELQDTNIESLSSLQLPVGSTAERPNPAEPGMIRFNTNYSSVEFYDGTNWRDLRSGIILL